jgi:hypothetical protein
MFFRRLRNPDTGFCSNFQSIRISVHHTSTCTGCAS